jgi:hypothetical protein
MHNELRAVGSFPDIISGKDVWVQFPAGKIRLYYKESGEIMV